MVLLADAVTPEKAVEWDWSTLSRADKFEAMVDESLKTGQRRAFSPENGKGVAVLRRTGDQRTGAFIETEAAASLSLTKDLNEGITSLFSRRAPKFKGQ